MTNMRARAADLRAMPYNCECQVGGVDAASVDADYLNSIGAQIDALLDDLATTRAEVERLRRTIPDPDMSGDGVRGWNAALDAIRALLAEREADR